MIICEITFKLRRSEVTDKERKFRIEVLVVLIAFGIAFFSAQLFFISQVHLLVVLDTQSSAVRDYVSQVIKNCSLFQIFNDQLSFIGAVH